VGSFNQLGDRTLINDFIVNFSRFGGAHDIEQDTGFGKFVQEISLPSISYTSHHRTNTKNYKLLLTAEYPTWNPVQVTLTDDPAGKMLDLAMRQCRRQDDEPLTALFRVTIEMPQTGRLYTYDYCSILHLRADRSLGCPGPSPAIPYIMWIQINSAIVVHHK
jgi:hypothetical protein